MRLGLVCVPYDHPACKGIFTPQALSPRETLLALDLPHDATIEAVSPHAFFFDGCMTFKISHEQLRDIPIGTRIPKVKAKWIDGVATKILDGWEEITP